MSKGKKKQTRKRNIKTELTSRPGANSSTPAGCNKQELIPSSKLLKRQGLAKAGWSVFIDALRLYHKLTGKEPTHVNVDSALEFVIQEYFDSQNILEANKITSIRQLNPLRIMGLIPTFDAKCFELRREDVAYNPAAAIEPSRQSCLT